MLLETHALYHQVLPRGRLTAPNRPPDFTRDPLAVGQVRPGVLPTPTDSEDSSSENELSIDLSDQPVPEEGESQEDQEDSQGDEVVEEPDPVKAILPEGQDGIHSWHSPQPDIDGPDEEMAEILQRVGIEVTDEGETEEPEHDQATSHKEESGEMAAGEKEEDIGISTKEETVEVEEEPSTGREAREPAVGEECELRGQEFTLTEEEVSASLEKDVICEQVFFDEHSDSDDGEEEEEPRLKIVSAYTLAAAEVKRAAESQ